MKASGGCENLKTQASRAWDARFNFSAAAPFHEDAVGEENLTGGNHPIASFGWRITVVARASRVSLKANGKSRRGLPHSASGRYKSEGAPRSRRLEAEPTQSGQRHGGTRLNPNGALSDSGAKLCRTL